MVTDVVGTTTAVSVSILRDPALVRTVRLVAAAVARRATADEEFVEEVRLAVGEASGLLIAESHGNGPIEVVLTLDHRLRVDVAAAGTPHGGPAEEADPSAAAELDAAAGMEPWTLLRGLVGDVALSQAGGRTRVTMTWPLH